ncbi:MAG: hypothetical protein V1725_05440 [archaeon]
MKHKFMQWVFVVALVVVYLPLVQISITTIFPRDNFSSPYAYPQKDCMVNGTQDDSCLEQQRLESIAYETQMQHDDTLRFLVAAIISFITVAIIWFIPFEPLIAYGLFVGAALNILFSLRFNVNQSIFGVIVLLLLFIISVLYVNKQLKK